MPETPRFYRLRIRNAADSADLLVVTSVRGGTNPYIIGAPSGDGQSFEPLTGKVATGSYRLAIVDEGAAANAVTLALADVNARQQLLSKRAFLESSPDGSAWTAYVPGYVNAVRMVNASRFEIAVGNSRRAELSTDVFKSVLLKRGLHTADGMPGLPTFTRFANATMLVGGPVLPGFLGAFNLGGWVVKATQIQADAGAGNASFVQLKLQENGWYDPRRASSYSFGFPELGSDDFDFVGHLNEETQPYFREKTKWFDWGINGYFPDLFARVETTAGVLVGHFTLLSVPFGEGVKRKDLLTRGPQTSFWVSWTESIQPMLDWLTGSASPGAGTTLSAPTVNTEYRLHIFAADISDRNPLHVVGHPMDIRRNLWLDADVAYDETARLAVRAKLGNDLVIALRPTEGSKMVDVEQTLDGLFGTATRINSAGERESFTTRIKDPAPVETITLGDLRSDAGTAWEIDEATVSNRITFKQKRFARFIEDYETEPPPDGITVRPETVIVDYGAATTPGDHETLFEIEGRLYSASQADVNAEDFTVGIAGEAFDRYGQGAISGTLHCLPSVTALIGDEVILDLPHLPNAVLGASPVSQRGGQRIVQIVERTETPSGPDIRWLDAGTSVQASTAPTFTLGLSATDPRRFADLVVTNAVALAAAGLKVRIEVATGAGAPSTGVLLTVLDPALQSTMTLPAFDAGTKVWIRMRSEMQNYRPSAWTAFTGLQLTVLDPPTSLAVAVQGADISRRLLTWVPGTNALDIPVEVYLRLTADPASTDRLIATLPAGSDQYELTGLDVANRTATVRHKESPPAGGFSSSATVAVNTTGSSGTLPVPTDPHAWATSVRTTTVGGWALRMGAFGQFGLWVTAQAEAAIEFEVSVAGGPYTLVQTIPAVLGERVGFSAFAPYDGRERAIRARHVAPSWTPSPYTTDALATPGIALNAGGDPIWAQVGQIISWNDLTDLPTDLAGYGIVDAANIIHTHTFASLTSKPTTIAGFGITDAYTKLYTDANFAPLFHTHPWGDIDSGKPTTIAGYGIVDAFTQAAADARYSALGHIHSFSQIASTPTDLAGYGIVDAANIIHSHSFASLTSKPTTISGFGITDAYTKLYTDANFAAFSHVHDWSEITSKPTTLAGYGITDPVALLNVAQAWSAVQTFAAGRLDVKASSLSAYVQFKTSAGVDRGFVGYGGSDSTFYVLNPEAGDTQIWAHNDVRVLASSGGGSLYGTWSVSGPFTMSSSASVGTELTVGTNLFVGGVLEVEGATITHSVSGVTSRNVAKVMTKGTAPTGSDSAPAYTFCAVV